MSKVLVIFTNLREKSIPFNRSCAYAFVLILILLLLTGCGGARRAETEAPLVSGKAEGTSLQAGTDVPEGAGSVEETSLPIASESAPKKETSATGSTEAETTEEIGGDKMFYAHVNGKVLSILAADNSSADALLDLLKTGDVTIEMQDYGSFEKVGPLGTTLPRNDEQITTEPGDVILYQGNQVTIYYDKNSWSFTRLGKIQGLSQAELKEILGSGNVTVRFSLSEKQKGA